MQYAEHKQEIRTADVAYARRQLEKHQARNRSGVCVVDASKRCARAWRCGFQAKVDGCVSFVMREGRGLSTVRTSVLTSCRLCAKRYKRNCGWECVNEVKGGGA